MSGKRGARPKRAAARHRARSGAGGIVTLPRAEYEALLARIEDLEDARALAAAEAAYDPDNYLPFELAERILDGESPLRVWRERRGKSLGQLASEAGVAKSYLSEIESGKKPGSLKAMRALAKALRLTVEDIAAE